MSEIRNPHTTTQSHVRTETKKLKRPGFHVGMRNIKTAFAATLCAAIYFLLDRNPAFACIGAVFGMGGNMSESRLNGGNRLFGTIIGGVLGIILFRIYIIFYPDGAFHGLMLVLLFFGIVLMILCSQFVQWPGAIQPGGVMLCIILFRTPVETYLSYSIDRIVDTAIGVIIALIVNAILPPERWYKIKAFFTKQENAPKEA